MHKRFKVNDLVTAPELDAGYHPTGNILRGRITEYCQDEIYWVKFEGLNGDDRKHADQLTLVRGVDRDADDEAQSVEDHQSMVDSVLSRDGFLDRGTGSSKTKSAFHRSWISIPTDEDIARLRTESEPRNAVRVLAHLNWSKMPLDALRNIIDIAKRAVTL